MSELTKRRVNQELVRFKRRNHVPRALELGPVSYRANRLANCATSAVGCYVVTSQLPSNHGRSVYYVYPLRDHRHRPGGQVIAKMEGRFTEQGHPKYTLSLIIRGVRDTQRYLPNPLAVVH
jgi:hypothetical protein